MQPTGWFQLLGATFGVLLVICASFADSETLVLSAFKEGIDDDPHLILSNWDAIDGDSCDWPGISCSAARDHVIKINVSGWSLRGFLAPELGQLTYLQQLVLHGNNLIGTIPKELGLLKNLEVLDLGMNQLAGPIPPEIWTLTSLSKLNLQSNGLTGKLPPELSNLKNMVELRLDRNRLQGTIPGAGNLSYGSDVLEMHASGLKSIGLCSLSQLRVADFSYNFFVGSIPKCLDRFPRSSFRGNCLQNQDPKQRPKAQCASSVPSQIHAGTSPNHRSDHHGASKPAWLLALEIATGTMVGCLFLVAVFTTVSRFKTKSSIIIPWKKSSSQNDHHMTVYIDDQMLKDVTRFGRQELEVACEDFSNIIGSSPDSLVYKGNIKGGPEIAVISLCIKEEHWTGYLELYFQREVADLARINHENTAKLLGYFKENSPFTRMLVFEYASNGTLYEHLHYGEGCQLSWTRRMKIGIGIARGLKYLHEELDPPFTISELNSGAVYLTEDFSPKLVDFESWKSILSRSEKNSGNIGSQGAICVLPNSLEGRHLDVKGNVYSFGVLLLEIVSGRPPYCKDNGCLVDWAKDYIERPEAMSCIVDPELKHFKYEDLNVVCEVVSLCIDPDLAKRPSMEELCGILESRIDTSVSVELSASLAWAELALSS